MLLQMFYKKAWVEYHPLGVVRHLSKSSDAAQTITSARHVLLSLEIVVRWLARAQVGAIVPWNYPFHNVFNPLTAALFAGNGIVIKVRCASSLLCSADGCSGDRRTTNATDVAGVGTRQLVDAVLRPHHQRGAGGGRCALTDLCLAFMV